MKKKSTFSILIGFIVIVFLVSYLGLNNEGTSIGQFIQNFIGIVQKSNPDTANIEKSNASSTEATPTQTLKSTVKPSQTKSTSPKTTTTLTPRATTPTQNILENGSYVSKEEVALYLHTYGRLPNNFITKKQAQELGWDNTLNFVGDVAEGKSIGGDRFGNFEGQLPKEKGRQYYECDIDYKGKKRNAKRIVYSNDGLIYYTDNHYESFTLLYNKDGRQ